MYRCIDVEKTNTVELNEKHAQKFSPHASRERRKKENRTTLQQDGKITVKMRSFLHYNRDIAFSYFPLFYY